MKNKNWWEIADPIEFQKRMEEMAGMPKEELGKRQPGERGMYERQRDATDL